MAWKDKSSATFTGGSGQMAVIAELLYRKCNAAIPHVDIGTDVFAFRDDSEEIARIQVKTARGRRYKKGKGYHAKLGIPMKQLEEPDVPRLFYALAVRFANWWGRFIVISRATLQELQSAVCGSQNDKSGDLELHIQFRKDEEGEEAGREQAKNEERLKAFCGKFNMSDHIDAWENLPPLRPPAGIDVDT